MPASGWGGLVVFLPGGWPRGGCLPGGWPRGVYLPGTWPRSVSARRVASRWVPARRVASWCVCPAGGLAVGACPEGFRGFVLPESCPSFWCLPQPLPHRRESGGGGSRVREEPGLGVPFGHVATAALASFRRPAGWVAFTEPKRGAGSVLPAARPWPPWPQTDAGLAGEQLPFLQGPGAEPESPRLLEEPAGPGPGSCVAEVWVWGARPAAHASGKAASGCREACFLRPRQSWEVANTSFPNSRRGVPALRGWW